MPVLIDVEHSDHHLFSRTPPAMRASRPPPGGWIDVGLVNNMPDAGLMSTERQVLELYYYGELNLRDSRGISPAQPESLRGWSMVCSERERQDAAGRPVCGAAPPASAHIPARDGLGVRFGADPARSAFPTEWKAKAALAVAPTTTAAPLRGGGATLFRGGFPPVRGSRTLPGSPHSVGRWWRHRHPWSG